jgi:Uncharacterized conserved protein
MKISNQPGNYLIVAALRQAEIVSVKSFEKRILPAGIYIYCGAAHGPGGLKARIQRHLSLQTVRFWHFDYLKIASISSKFGGKWRNSTGNVKACMRWQTCRERVSRRLDLEPAIAAIAARPTWYNFLRVPTWMQFLPVLRKAGYLSSGKSCNPVKSVKILQEMRNSR